MRCFHGYLSDYIVYGPKVHSGSRILHSILTLLVSKKLYLMVQFVEHDRIYTPWFIFFSS